MTLISVRPGILQRDKAMEIIPMKSEHIKAAARLEKECFTMPRSENALSEELSNPLTSFFVCVDNGAVVGYIGSYNVADEVSVTDVAVTEAFRGRGAGNALVCALIDKAKSDGARLVTLEVRLSNEAAIALYLKNGFEKIGVRRGFYSQPKEDALIMTRYL